MTIQHLRDLHAETTADAYSAACAEGDCSGHDDEGDCPVTEVGICDYCYDHSGGVEWIPDWMLWPCETIRAVYRIDLDDLPSTPPRPPWIDPRACFGHCDPEGWHVPCADADDEIRRQSNG